MTAESLARLEEILASPAVIRLADPSAHDCALVYEAKCLYEDIYPETRQGGDRGNAFTSHFADPKSQHTDIEEESEQTDNVSFCSMVAERADCDPRTVRRAVRIGRLIGPEIRDRLRDSDVLNPRLYRHQAQLLALTHHGPETQSRILDLIEAGKAATVAEAEERLKLRAVPPKAERDFAQDKRRWQSRSLDGRRRFVQWLRDTGQLDALLEGETAMPAVDLDQYLSAADIAAEKLPGLPASKKGILELAQRSGWHHIENKIRGGTVKLFAIKDLPGDARRQIERRRKIAEAQRLRDRERIERGTKTFRTVEVAMSGEGDDPAAGAKHG